MINEWGFVLKPVGSIGAASRFLILIGYPFVSTAPPPTPTVPYVDSNLHYYRQYMLDLRSIPSTSLTTINLTPIDESPDIDYFRKYLGERT